MSGFGRAPCLIGVAQRTYRGAEAPEPLDMWHDVACAAAEDSGGRSVLAALESAAVVYCQSWQYDDAPGRLLERLGVTGAAGCYSGIGGTTPQVLVSGLAERILDGSLDLALVVSGEALATRRRLRKEGGSPQWSHREAERSPFPFEAPFHPAEVAHEVFQAWLTFPVFDVARRAHAGTAPDVYRRELGALMAPMTEVAAANPHAWFPVRRGPDELVTPTPENRMVAYPYTKYLVSVMDVDMAAALLVASDAKADELGVPRDRRVYLQGWGAAEDPTYLAEHGDLWRSPAMEAAGAAALGAAGVGMDDIAHLDLYSCFGSSIHFARDALGLAEDDGRSVTVTGGLPFAGGPGSGYLTHAIAAMADVLRADTGALGLVSGVGMHMTKHAFGVYGGSPGPGPGRPDEDALRRRMAEAPVRAITEVATGPATLATYTVAHARDGTPEWGLAICDLPDGTRCYGKVVDPDLLRSLEEEEGVGSAVDLVAGEGHVNLVRAG